MLDRGYVLNLSFHRLRWGGCCDAHSVMLNLEHIAFLKKNFPEVNHMVAYGTFPYVPAIFKCPFYFYVGKSE
jgi:hypothetical protein